MNIDYPGADRHLSVRIGQVNIFTDRTFPWWSDCLANAVEQLPIPVGVHFPIIDCTGIFRL